MHTLKVIHIRQSSSDLKRYANWSRENGGEEDTDDESTQRESQSEMDTETEWNPDSVASTTTEQRDQSGDIDILLEDVNQIPELVEPLHRLAHWAFGPEGFASVRLIAYGDFSYDGWCAKSDLLLSRTEGLVKYTVNRHDDTIGNSLSGLEAQGKEMPRDLVEKYANMLAVCPAGRLFED